MDEGGGRQKEKDSERERERVRQGREIFNNVVISFRFKL